MDDIKTVVIYVSKNGPQSPSLIASLQERLRELVGC